MSDRLKQLLTRRGSTAAVSEQNKAPAGANGKENSIPRSSLPSLYSAGGVTLLIFTFMQPTEVITIYRQSTFTWYKNAHARAVTQAKERHKNGVTKEGAAAGSMSVKLAANCVCVCVIKYLMSPACKGNHRRNRRHANLAMKTIRQLRLIIPKSPNCNSSSGRKLVLSVYHEFYLREEFDKRCIFFSPTT